MDVYLIDRDRWSLERAQLLERAGLAGFPDPGPVLAQLGEVLLAQYRATNDRSADNPHLRIRADGTFMS